jgi:SAM-dependent methyltransferase
LGAPSEVEDAGPWYEQAFRDDYRRVYAHRDLDGARPEVAFLLAHGVHGRVLDLCCGFGRHMLLMAESGLEVHGLDLSFELLRAARELPGYETHLAGHLVRADMTQIPCLDRSFDSLVNLFSSFGYLGEEGDRRVLAEIARVLRRGGTAVLDSMNPTRVREDLVAHSTRSGPDFELEEHRRLEDRGRRVVKQVELRLATGEARRWREDVRLYEAAELDAMLFTAGLLVQTAWGDFDGSDAGPQSPRRIVLARRG